MHFKRILHGKPLRYAAILSLTAGLFGSFGPLSAYAGREGVYIADNAYFALDGVTMAPGADDQLLRFGVELVNGSGSSIDFNRYGVRIVDQNGNRYEAELSERSVARVDPNGTSTFQYLAHVPAGISADSLKVDVFEWNFGGGDYMNDLGELNVGAALTPNAVTRPTVVLNLSDIDSSYPADAFVSFELIRSYKALSNGSWYLYTDLAVENGSSSSLKLPAGLQFVLKDEAGLSYTVSTSYDYDQTILPHQRSQIGLQTAIGSATDSGSYTLELDCKASSSSGTSVSSSSNAGSGAAGTGLGNSGSSSTASSSSSRDASGTTETVMLGKLELARYIQLNAVGESASYATKDPAALKMSVDKVTSALKSDGIHVDAAFSVTNSSASAVQVPALSGSFQLTHSTLSVAAADTVSSHPSYLTAGESTTYHFAGVLPKGVDPSAVQLAVLEKKSAGSPVFVPVNITQLPANVDTSGAGAPGSIATPVGNLDITLQSTYRLKTESGDDILMSEVSVRNADSKIVALPSAASFYGGHMIGDFDAQGKAVRIQSSPYLNPGQKTTIYVYSKIPYDTEVKGGYVYIGDGTSNPQGVWTQQNEWTELPFASVGDSAEAAALGQEWFIADAGRMSTGKIVDSKVYDTGTQKTVAVRVAQTSKETRSGTNVPYIGYITDANGGVWALKTTEDAQRMSLDGQAMTTLWATLPSSTVDQGGLQVVFGEKIDDNAFASAQSYAFAVSPETGSVSGSSLSNVSLYPYTISMSNVNWRSPGANTIEISFDYTQSEAADMTGSAKDRNLEFALVDSSGNVISKTLDYPLDGTLTIPSVGGGSTTVNPLSTGENNKLTFNNLTVDQLVSFVNSPRIAVYEKFEGGLRQIGILSPTIN